MIGICGSQYVFFKAAACSPYPLNHPLFSTENSDYNPIFLYNLSQQLIQDAASKLLLTRARLPIKSHSTANRANHQTIILININQAHWASINHNVKLQLPNRLQISSIATKPNRHNLLKKKYQPQPIEIH